MRRYYLSKSKFSSQVAPKTKDRVTSTKNHIKVNLSPDSNNNAKLIKEISEIISKINKNFDFKYFTKYKLQNIEPVRNFIYLIYIAFY